MDQSEKIEIFKIILKKNLSPDNIVEAYENYKKAIRMIEETSRCPLPLVSHHLICNSCHAGHHEECRGFFTAIVGGRGGGRQFTKQCFCPVCHPED